jgi:YwiC-like protein
MSENAVATPSAFRLKTVALPAEHGGWAFLLEPALLGLLVAPSAAGVWLSLAALAVFLLEHPLKMALKDRRKSKRFTRTIWAERMTLIYAAAAVLTLTLAVLTAAAPFWLPLALAVPFALVKTRYDMLNRGREVIPEIAGAVALAAVAPAIVMASGWALIPALALWLIPALRAIASILYVRVRLRLERGKQVTRTTALAAHGLALLVAVAVAYARLLPWLAAVAMAVLLIRAAVGLSDRRLGTTARAVGFQEIGWGMLTVILVALGYRMGL